MNEPFALFDCCLLRRATGRSCANLRELLTAISSAHDQVLEHHLMRCALEDHFELNEFPNDFARWCWESLGDHALAEQLALVDPYRFPDISSLRSALLDRVENHLWSLPSIPWSRPGLELHLIESELIAYDTAERFSTVQSLLDAIPKMSIRSLYFHIHEARRRTGGKSDDFSSWLAGQGADPALVTRIRQIDFYFLNLNQLRDALLDALSPGAASDKSIPTVNA
jgi:hypothetical protein